MKYIWLILISLIAVPVFSAPRTDTYNDATTIEDSWATTAALDNNWGADTRLRTTNGTRFILIRLVLSASIQSIPTNFLLDSCKFVLFHDSINTSANRIDSAYVVYRPWAEGTGNNTLVLLGQNQMTWNKYGGDESVDDFPWGTAGCQNTTSDRRAAAFAFDTAYSSAAAGDSMEYWLRDTAVLNDWRNGGATYAGGIKINQLSSGQVVMGSSENGTAGRRPKVVVYSHSVDGTNQRIANGILGTRISNGLVSRRLRADYGH